MSPERMAARLMSIATYIRVQRQHVIVVELAVRGFDPTREDVAVEAQVAAISEMLLDIAQRLDEHAAGIVMDVERKVAA